MNNKDTYYKKKYIKYKYKYYQNTNNKIKAIGFFNDIIKGTVYFDEININTVEISVDLSGFEPNSIHGFHIHQYGDLTDGCTSMCDHFNPYDKNHGNRTDIERHVGDLGNLIADSNGIVKIKFSDSLIKLRGNIANIIGRGLIIHENIDDCGKTNHPLSKITGNSGKRISCAIIGYAK